MAETESKTRRELLKYRIVCALSPAAEKFLHALRLTAKSMQNQ